MSIRSLLYSFQEIYPFPAQTKFFEYDITINGALVQDAVQEIILNGIPDIADYGITDPVAIVTATSDNSFAVISGINVFDWGAGTARLWVSYANVADFTIKLFVCQSKAQLD
jgi:hypothetical protein